MFATAEDPAASVTTTERDSPGRRMPFAAGAAESEAACTDGEGLAVAATAAADGSDTPSARAPAARVARSRRAKGRRSTGEPEGGEVTVIRASVARGGLASRRV